MKNQNNDMTVGAPLPLVLRFALPMLIGGIFQQLYNMVDTIIVGNVVGSGALAALGATGSTTFMLLSVTIGLTNAFSVVMGQFFGAKNYEKMKVTLVSAIYITIISAVVLSILGIVGARPLMQLLGTPADIIDDAVLYLQICFGASFGLVFYNAASSILRAVGDSKTPLYFLIVASLLNVGLDLLFVLNFGWAIMGVGIATVISQTVAAVLCIIFMLKKYPMFHLKKADFKADKGNITTIITMGLPMSLQNVLVSAGEMAITGVVNSFGTNVVAAFTAGLRIQQLTMLVYNNSAQAFSSFAAQNLGAGKLDRIQEGFKKLALITLGFCLVTAIAIFGFGDVIIRLFISETDVHAAEILSLTRGYMRITASFYPFLGLIWLYTYTLRGVGEVRIPFISSIIELAAKVGLSFALAYLVGYIGVWFANPIGWALGLIPPMICYHSGAWKAGANRIVGRKDAP